MRVYSCRDCCFGGVNLSVPVEDCGTLRRAVRARAAVHRKGRRTKCPTSLASYLTARSWLHYYPVDYGFTTSTPQLTLPTFPAPSVASAVQVMRVPLPPESRTVIVSPENETIHESVLSMILPFLVTLKQSYSVTTAGSGPSQTSSAVAVNEIGASGGVIVAGALQNTSGGVVSSISTC